MFRSCCIFFNVVVKVFKSVGYCKRNVSLYADEKFPGAITLADNVPNSVSIRACNRYQYNGSYITVCAYRMFLRLILTYPCITDKY